MKSSIIAFFVAVASATFAAVIKEENLPLVPTNDYNLTLILEGAEENAVWRLTDDNIPDFVSKDPSPVVVASPANASQPNTPLIQKRWSRTCDKDNAAVANDCRILTESIRYSSNKIPNNLRHIVYSSCFISWNKAINAQIKALWPGAADTLAQCTFNPGQEFALVSGIANNYHSPNNVHQCMSNRAKHC
jgi:hypothetical protein